MNQTSSEMWNVRKIVCSQESRLFHPDIHSESEICKIGDAEHKLLKYTSVWFYLSSAHLLIGFLTQYLILYTCGMISNILSCAINNIQKSILMSQISLHLFCSLLFSLLGVRIPHKSTCRPCCTSSSPANIPVSSNHVFSCSTARLVLNSISVCTFSFLWRSLEDSVNIYSLERRDCYVRWICRSPCIKSKFIAPLKDVILSSLPVSMSPYCRLDAEWWFEMLKTRCLSYERFLGTRGAVLHHSAETVLCFRNHIFFPSPPSPPQSLSSGQRRPAYGVERAPCAFSNILVSIII